MRNISTQEFNDRLEGKLKGMSAIELFSLIPSCYEEVSEVFNNEILTEWESEQQNNDD